MGFLPIVSRPMKAFLVVYSLAVMFMIYYVVINQESVVGQAHSVFYSVYDRVFPAELSSERIKRRMHHAIIMNNLDYLKSLCIEDLSPEEREKLTKQSDKPVFEHFDPFTQKIVCDMEAETLGFTMLMSAYMSDKPSVAKLLLEMSADPNRLDQDHSLLMVAVDRNQTEWVDLFLQHKANPNVLHPNTDYSPLMLATFNDHRQISLQLIEAGANINYQVPKTGISALMLATANGLETMVQLLLASGADSFLEDVKERTAMEIARVHGEQKLELLLMGHMSRNMPADTPSDFTFGGAAPAREEETKTDESPKDSTKPVKPTDGSSETTQIQPADKTVFVNEDEERIEL